MLRSVVEVDNTHGLVNVIRARKKGARRKWQVHMIIELGHVL